MEVEAQAVDNSFHQEQMFNLIKKTYENGNLDQMTIRELMEQLKIDLQGALGK